MPEYWACEDCDRLIDVSTDKDHGFDKDEYFIGCEGYRHPRPAEMMGS